MKYSSSLHPRTDDASASSRIGQCITAGHQCHTPAPTNWHCRILRESWKCSDSTEDRFEQMNRLGTAVDGLRICHQLQRREWEDKFNCDWWGRKFIGLTMSSGEITNRFAEDSISETVLSQNHEFVLLSRLQVLHCHLRDFRVLNRNRLPILRVHQTVPDVVFDCGSSDTWKRGEMLSPL